MMVTTTMRTIMTGLDWPMFQGRMMSAGLRCMRYDDHPVLERLTGL